MINADDLEAFGYWAAAEPPAKPMTVPQMVKEFSAKTGQLPKPYLYAALIAEETDEWRSEYLHDTSEAQLKELADLVYVVYGYANAKGWDLDEAVRRVHENNLGRCIQPDGTVHRRADGKILKNPDYPKVDLTDLV
jgi:predicted HAD superfamily Cof-like phosphohydrolase